MQKAWSKGKSFYTEIYQVFSNIVQRKYKWVIEWTTVSMQTRRLMNNISSPHFMQLQSIWNVTKTYFDPLYIHHPAELNKRLKIAVKIYTIFNQYQNEVTIKLTCQKLLFWRLQRIKSVKMLFLSFMTLKRRTKRL